MAADWDMPTRASGGTGRKERRFAAGPVDPLAFAGFIMRNIVKIGAVALAITVAGVMLIMLVPFPYSATAVVLVDPREQNVTLQEDVLSPIGSDSAVLESMVQIVRTDGFLMPLLSQLGLVDTAKDSREDQLKVLARFRRDLNVSRRGATYLIEITYRGKTAEEAARVANAVAKTFADYHNGALDSANQNAARALSERLVELRRNLTESEKAVADFQAQNNIVYLDQGGTVQKRELSELSAQLATARNDTEQARARYEEALKGNGVGQVGSEDANGPTAQYNTLRQQRGQLERELAELGTVYGPRHPRIELTRQAMANLDRQIAEEGRMITEQLKRSLEVAQSRQDLLTAQLNRLSSGVSMTNTAEVELEALRREAAADRAIYESFLNRNKATDELAAINAGNVRVVSEAIAPLASTRPSLALMGVAFAGLGFLLGSAGLAALAGPAAGIGAAASEPGGADPDDRPGRTAPRRHSRTTPAQRPDLVHRPYQPGTATRSTALLRTPPRQKVQGGSLLEMAEDRPIRRRAASR